MTTTVKVSYTDDFGNVANLILTLGPVAGDSGNPVLNIAGTFNGNSITYPTNDPRVPYGLTGEFYANPSAMPRNVRQGFAFLVNSNPNSVAVLYGDNPFGPRAYPLWVAQVFPQIAANMQSSEVTLTVTPITSNTYIVKSAIYGAAQTNAYQCTAGSVASELQNYLNKGITQLVICNGLPTPNPAVHSPYPPFPDAAPSLGKVFAAWVNVNGIDQYYACTEGQTIDFSIAPKNNLA